MTTLYRNDIARLIANETGDTIASATKFAPITGEAALAMRKKLNVNQSEFWSRVGIGQSAGSRYESGRNIPRPVQMLLRLAYGTQAQAAKQLEVLRPSITAAATEEVAS